MNKLQNLSFVAAKRVAVYSSNSADVYGIMGWCDAGLRQVPDDEKAFQKIAEAIWRKPDLIFVDPEKVRAGHRDVACCIICCLLEEMHHLLKQAGEHAELGAFRDASARWDSFQPAWCDGTPWSED